MYSLKNWSNLLAILVPLCVWDSKNGDSIKSSDVEPYVFARLPRSSIFPHVNRT